MWVGSNFKKAMPRELAAVLTHDPIVRLFLVVLAISWFPFIFPILSSSQLDLLANVYADLFLIPVTVLAFQHRLGEIAHRGERAFWNLFTVALGLFWVVKCIHAFVPSAPSGIATYVVADSLSVAVYLAILGAIETKPHMKLGDSEPVLEGKVGAIGVTVFVIGLLVYFVFLPSRFNEEIYLSWFSSQSLVVVLDVTLLLWFVYLRQMVRVGRWRTIYGLLALWAGCWVIADLVELVEYLNALNWSLGAAIDLLWFFAYLPLVLAARHRHHFLPADEEAIASASELQPGGRMARAGNLLVVYAFAFPVLHFSFSMFGVLDPALRAAREVVVLLCLLVLGGLALADRVLVEKKSRALQSERARAQEEIRKLNEELEQRVAERTQALRDREELLGAVLDGSPGPIFVKDLQGRYLTVNRWVESLFHMKREDILGKTDYEFLPKDVADEFRRFDVKVLEAGGPIEREEEIPTKNGVRTYITWKYPLFNEQGTPYAICGIATDITESKQAEENLHESEEQLRQAQKMEAVGRLAGGVAHDFNNLLMVMRGYGELMLNRLDANDPLRRNAEEIQKAAERATALTQQLLAFSRKQVLQPKVLDLNAVVTDVEKMLRRLIGEDIELTAVLDLALGWVKADPGQIEQIILNLAVNARDAMPQGGRLTLKTSNVTLDQAYVRQHMGATPGPYVLLAVSDTGVGMDAETQSHIFEPFFTTKGAGKGTGLGLSTVYGIVKQSGGYIWVESTPGRGTTFEIYLPLVEEAAASGELHPALLPPTPGGTETILVVEDEMSVRKLAAEFLGNNGYRVLEAQDGGEALQVCEEHRAPIHLLMTDVVMPGMSGRELAVRLTGARPGMKVIYVSGYTDDAIVQHGVREEGTVFLQKPFSLDALAHTVREALDSKGKK